MPTVDLRRRRGRCTAPPQHPPPRSRPEEAVEGEESHRTRGCHLEAAGAEEWEYLQLLEQTREVRREAPGGRGSLVDMSRA